MPTIRKSFHSRLNLQLAHISNCPKKITFKNPSKMVKSSLQDNCVGVPSSPNKLFLIAATVTIFTLILFPAPSEMADFMIGCSKGNFRPSATCEAVCLLLHNRTACCYGVNYDSRAVCACCNYAISTPSSPHQPHNKVCPTVCSANCHIITLNAGNCSELRGTKHRSGGGVGPSIINDLSILNDVPSGHWGLPKSGGGPSSSSSVPRLEIEGIQTDAVSVQVIEEKLAGKISNSTASSVSSSPLLSAPAPQRKYRPSALSSKTKELFSKLSSSLDFSKEK